MRIAYIRFQATSSEIPVPALKRRLPGPRPQGHMTHRTLLGVTVICMAAGPAAQAQSYGNRWQRHHFSAGLGIAMPRQELQPGYQNAFGWTLGYGYRPLPYLQIDAGYEGSYNAADVNDFYDQPAFGPLRIRDFQTFLPFGARVILPLAGGRVEVFGGGGGAYLRYSENLRQPSDWVRVGCPVCRARDGFGWQALAGFAVGLNPGNAMKLGVFTRVYDATTSGPPVGNIWDGTTKDRWLNTYLSLSFSF